MNPNPTKITSVLLADDDIDDCMLFKDAITELNIAVEFSCVYDGEQLMRRLSTESALPALLFLDLNMPRKNGIECLSELKGDERTRHLPVIVISTSYNTEIIKLLHERGAHYYIRKPDEFEKLKHLISQGINLINRKPHSSFNEFVLNS